MASAASPAGPAAAVGAPTAPSPGTDVPALGPGAICPRLLPPRDRKLTPRKQPIDRRSSPHLTLNVLHLSQYWRLRDGDARCDGSDHPARRVDRRWGHSRDSAVLCEGGIGTEPVAGGHFISFQMRHPERFTVRDTEVALTPAPARGTTAAPSGRHAEGLPTAKAGCGGETHVSDGASQEATHITRRNIKRVAEGSDAAARPMATPAGGGESEGTLAVGPRTLAVRPRRHAAPARSSGTPE
ncbi:hypothetical protein N9L68_00640 [bacterium]|nr:hypothetical protein [bacterium]